MSYYQFSGPVQGGFGPWEDEMRRRKKHHLPYQGGVTKPSKFEKPDYDVQMDPPDLPAQRMLLVHAHPDDETIGQGATMARYVAEGRGVTLVTCTGGEMGEILVPELEHLAGPAGTTPI